MIENLSKLFEFIRVPIKYIIGACIAAALVLFSPDAVVAKLGLLEYRDKYRFYFGLLVLMLVALIFANVVGAVGSKVSDYSVLRARRKRLQHLTMGEMQVLGPYIAKQTRTQYLNIQDGVVQGLTQEEIIYRSSSISAGSTNFAYNIQPWAWEYLNEHPDIFEKQLKKLLEKK